jgi:hypothetical protein
LEPVVAEIWQELLHVERVGRQDNFFELGGHSLLATRVIGRIRQKLPIQVTPRALFAAPTLEAFAKSLETLLWLKASTARRRSASESSYSEEGVI